MQNTIKDNIKNALQVAGFSTGVHNSIYMNSQGVVTFGSLVMQNKTYLKKGK